MFPNQYIFCLEKIIYIIHIIRKEVTISIHLLVGQKPYLKHLAFMEFIYGIISHVPYKLMILTRLNIDVECIVKTYIQNNNIAIFRLNF